MYQEDAGRRQGMDEHGRTGADKDGNDRLVFLPLSR
jgi:hypothetical protein